MGLVREVQLAKQLRPPLNEQEIADLALRLEGLGLSLRRLREMGENVIRRTTYGNIAFEHWIADDIVTREELDEERRAIARYRERVMNQIEDMLDERIAKRIQLARAAVSTAAKESDIAALELAALEEEEHEWAKERSRLAERLAKDTRLRMGWHAQTLRQMPHETRLKVLKEAVKRGILASYDQAIVDHLHLFPDKLFPVLEEWGMQSGTDKSSFFRKQTKLPEEVRRSDQDSRSTTGSSRSNGSALEEKVENPP